MAQLAQTYVHLRPYEISQRRIETLGDRIHEFSKDAARQIYGGNVTIDVRLDSGSLKSWITIAGVIGALHGGFEFVKDYPDFKIGIAELCDDARTFSAEVSREFIHSSKASHHQVYRTERRLKAPGKISRIIKKIETLDLMAGKLSSQQLREQLDSIERDLKSLEWEMSDEETRELHRKLFRLSPLRNLPERQSLPERPKVTAPIRKTQPELFIPDSELRHVAPPTPGRSDKFSYHKTVYLPPPPHKPSRR